jgi:Pup amidohydrolase
VAASWDSVIFDTGRDALQRVPMREPLKGTRDVVEDLFAEAPDAASLVDRLQT